MKRLIESIILIFRDISVYDILNAHKSPEQQGYVLSAKMFQMLANRHIPELSNNELSNLYYSLYNRIMSEKQIHSTMRSADGYVQRQSINPFDAVAVLADYLLTESYGIPQCKYDRILLWRELSHELDQDLFIIAMMVKNDINNPGKPRHYTWRPVIGHNNNVLSRLVERGISENHMHLNGAAQYFQLSWINLMNQSENSSFRSVLNKMGRNSLNHAYLSFDYRNDSLYLRCRKAAALRLFLFDRIVSLSYNKEDPRFFSFEGIYKILDSTEQEMEILCDDIDSYTTAIAELCPGSGMKYDYAMYKLPPYTGINDYFCGERWLMYMTLDKIYRDGKNAWRIRDLFHIYILLKESVRCELIQNNPVIGFDNFRLYQDRKSELIDNTPLERIYQRTAVYDTIENQRNSLRIVEARIAPRDSAEQDHNYIIKVDNNILINVPEKLRKEYLKRFFYVFHFIKSPQKYSELKADDLCRNSLLRESVRTKAMAMIEFREEYRESAQRVRGIDAANVEIGCRPEVFAQAFRVLRAHESTHIPGLKNSNMLHVSYHVGEDYIDLIDGLRAIDEAVKFLNMHCGDRLGHALALGVDAAEWYDLKKGVINIPQQDYLDNIVWLYFKILDYKIDVDGSLLPYLENEFQTYFRIIYANNTSDQYIRSIFGNAADNVIKSFEINTYHNAWKLRGDDPQKYISGIYENPEYTDLWEWNAINRTYPQDKRIRENSAVTFLYFLYHYNSDAKIEGSRCVTIKIPKMMQNAVCKVQKMMQKEIAYKGLCIEVNLSSNCLIGTFGKYNYANHPILNFYNRGLEAYDDDCRSCSQISVCINTDDPSVFGTCLENEYALIVRALEDARLPDGSRKYKRTDIYSWIDAIRIMGNDCVFKDENSGLKEDTVEFVNDSDKIED